MIFIGRRRMLATRGEKYMTVLVTGAPGWLGTRLIERLKENDKKVRALVLPTVDVSELKKIGVDEIVYGDITKKDSLNKAVDGIETVFHCAGMIHPKLFRSKDFYMINRDGTKNLIDVSVNAGVKKFIYISSNSAQGVNVSRDRLMKESDKERPYTDYGKSKYMAEQIVKEFQALGKIDTVIIRPCWFYGPRLPKRMIKLMDMIKNGKVLLFGDGKNIRSMTHIDNLIDALMLVEKNKKAVGQTYWIADERPHTTIEIYEEIAKNLGVKNLKIRRTPKILSRVLEVFDILLGKFGIYEINIHVGGEMSRDIGCSIEKAKQELGYEPKVSFEEGIKDSVEWAKEQGLV